MCQIILPYPVECAFLPCINSDYIHFAKSDFWYLLNWQFGVRKFDIILQAQRKWDEIVE